MTAVLIGGLVQEFLDELPPSVAAPEKFESLAAAFEQAAAIHRDRTALGAGAWQPTYGALNASANRFAHALLRHGALQDRVAVLMQHDTPLIGAIVSVLKAGRIAVALNPT